MKKYAALTAAFLILAASVIFFKTHIIRTADPAPNGLSSGTTQPVESMSQNSSLADEANLILCRENLSYDEGYLFEQDGTLCEVTGAVPLTDLDEVRKYYPKWTIPKTFQGYQFRDFTVGMNTFHPVYQSVEDPGEDPGEVFQRNISFSHAGYAAIRYIKGQNLLTIIIMDSDKTPAPCTDEQIKQTGRCAEYTVLKGLPGLEDYCYGFRFNTEDKKHTVEVSSARIHRDASEIETSSDSLENYNTEQGMRDLIETLNLKENLHQFSKEV